MVTKITPDEVLSQGTITHTGEFTTSYGVKKLYSIVEYKEIEWRVETNPETHKKNMYFNTRKPKLKPEDDVLSLEQVIAILSGHSGSVNSTSFSPDENRIVTAGDDGAIENNKW